MIRGRDLCYHPPQVHTCTGTQGSLAFSQDLIGYGFEEIDAARGFSEHTTDRRIAAVCAWLDFAHPFVREERQVSRLIQDRIQEGSSQARSCPKHLRPQGCHA